MHKTSLKSETFIASASFSDIVDMLGDADCQTGVLATQRDVKQVLQNIHVSCKIAEPLKEALNKCH